MRMLPEALLVLIACKTKQYILAGCCAAYFFLEKVSLKPYVPHTPDSYDSVYAGFITLLNFNVFAVLSVLTSVKPQWVKLTGICYFCTFGSLGVLYWYDESWVLIFGTTPSDNMKSNAVQFIEGILHAAVLLLVVFYTRWGLNFIPLISYAILLLLSQGEQLDYSFYLFKLGVMALLFQNKT